METLRSAYRAHPQARIMLSTAASFAINAVYGLGQLFLGVYLLSPWFIVNAAYTLLLCFARGYTLKQYNAIARMEGAARRYAAECAAYKRSGLFLCLLGISYLFVCLRMYFLAEAAVYTGYSVYFIACMAFTKLGVSIRGIFANRRKKSPVVTALRSLSFINALVSIVVAQCAILGMQHIADAPAYSAITGVIVSAVAVGTGGLMYSVKCTMYNDC